MRSQRDIRLLGALLLAAGTFFFVGACAREGSATEEDCAAILDRIVELELSEMGFADPELLERKQGELRARYSQELSACVGRPLAAGALACARHAESTEELSHDCLK